MESQRASLKIFKSSAGSGKTYQLVLNYLTLILKSNNPDKFKRILAITFTNKAAQEMKERVLEGLKKLRNGEDLNFIADYQKSTGLAPHELSEKATILLSNILHNYSHLNILTIDKFVHKIIRSFSRELGLTTNFELTFDFDSITARCVDEVLQELGNDDHLTNILVEYYKQLIDQEDHPNIERALAERASILNKEESVEKLAFYKDKDLSFFVDVRKDIRKNIQELKKEVLEHKKVIESVVGTDLEYLKNGSTKAFNSILEGWDKGSIPATYSDSQLKKVQNQEWLSKSKAKDFRQLVNTLELHGNEIQQRFLAINEIIPKISFLQNLDKNLMSFALLNDVQQQLEQFKTDNNIVFIGELNRIISDIIGKESAPYIYEKIGTRFENYFVDEFQDTSELQWKNLVPLIHDSLASGNQNLIVGDAKQSIYRWRGGNAQQFIDLPVVNLEIADIHAINRSFDASHDGEVLRDNYRSSNAVIEFNNWLFPNLAAATESSLITEMYKDAKQNLKRSNEGLVEVLLFNKGTEYNKEAPYDKELLRQINDCLADGYTLKDICILVRTNKDGAELANFLQDKKINVTSQDSLLLSESPLIKSVYALLKVLHRDTEENILRLFASFQRKELITLFETYRIPAEKTFYNSGYDLKAFLANELPQFDKTHFSQLSIFDQIDYLVQLLEFSREDLYIDKLMNATFEFQQRNGHQTGRFLEYFEEKILKSSVVPSDQNEAITIMTIHKSKGLQFPVVILPKRIESKPDDSLWLSGSTLSNLGLKEINMSLGKNIPDSETELIKTNSGEQHYVDLLNMIYVAYTRAEDRMYLHFVADRSQEFTKKQISLIENHPNFSQESSRLTIGQRENYSKEKVGAENRDIQISTNGTTNWRNVLIMATPSNEQIVESDTLNEKNWGIAIHKILQDIHSLEEYEPVIERFVRQNKEWKLHRSEIFDTIQQFTSHTEVQHIYSNSEETISERAIGSRAGITLRPDKVIIKKEEVIVIDFKTGNALPKHKEQVLTYAEVLKSIYTQPIKLYLIYLSKDKITVLNV